MKKLQNTMEALQNFILQDEDFQTYYKQSRQLKNLNGYKKYITEWLQSLTDIMDGYLLDKKYLDISWFMVNENIIDMDSLYLDFQSDVKSYYNLNPKSL
jgi:hypothetical protein